MVTMQISVSETTAKWIERTVRERQFADPSEYIEELIEADHADALDIDPEHKKSMMEQVRDALESDPADDIEVTPEYWEAKREKLDVMIQN
jgi:Arc/MetJ-type ribon-helix-helix transcriptional regulator